MIEYDKQGYDNGLTVSNIDICLVAKLFRNIVFVCTLFFPPLFASDKLNHIKNYLVYYGQDWSEENIKKARKFDLIVIHPGKNNQNINAALVSKLKRKDKNGRPGPLVLAYLSIGEDENPERGPRTSDKEHQGPVARNKDGTFVFAKNGFRNFYVDQRTLRFTKDGNKIWGQDGLPETKPGTDKLPDENGKWNSYFVNVKDKGWQSLLKHKSFFYLAPYGCDGIFLDTVDTASPWGPYGWMQKDMVDLIVKIRSWYPEKIIVMNRGLFLFEKYGQILNKNVDALMFESYVNEWNWYDKIGSPHRWYLSNRAILQNILKPLNKSRNGIYILFLHYYDQKQYEAPFFKNEIGRSTHLLRAAHYVSSPDLQKISPRIGSMRLSLLPKVKLIQTDAASLDIGAGNDFKVSMSLKKDSDSFQRYPFVLPTYVVGSSKRKIDLSNLEAGKYQTTINFFDKNDLLVKQATASISIPVQKKAKKIKDVKVEVRDGALLLKWPKRPGVTKYVIKWSTDRFSLSREKVITGANEFLFESLKNGLSHYFKVAQIIDDKPGYFSEVTFAAPVDTSAPQPPKILTHIVKKDIRGRCLEIKWRKSPSKDVAGYHIYVDRIVHTRGLPIKLTKTKNKFCVTISKGEYNLAMASFDSHNNESTFTKTIAVVVP